MTPVYDGPEHVDKRTIRRYTAIPADRSGGIRLSSPIMTVFVELAVPSESLTVGRLLPPEAAVRVELARVVPVGMPVRCCWFIGDDHGVAIERLRADPEVRIEAIEQLPNRALVRLDGRDETGFLTLATDAGGTVLGATGADDEWTVRLRFHDHDALATLQGDCEDHGIRVRLHQIHEMNSTDSTERFGLSDQQRETLLDAYRRDYFEIPRSTSISELASTFGVSDQAVSERLRRGIAALLAATVLDRQNRPETDSP